MEDLPAPGPVREALADGVRLAWRAQGDGATDILFAPGFVSHVGRRRDIAESADFDARLAAGHRLLLFDKRGTGLSARDAAAPSHAHTVADMLAVLDAAGSERAIVFAVSECGPPAALLAAQHPERVRALVIYGSSPRGSAAPDFPHAGTRAQWDAWLDRLVADWGRPASVAQFAPGRAGDADFCRRYADYLRAAAPPVRMRAIMARLRDTDVRGALRQVAVPALVVHRRGDRLVRRGAGEAFAAAIPGARCVLLDGDDHWWFAGDAASVLAPVREFIGGLPR